MAAASGGRNARAVWMQGQIDLLPRAKGVFDHSHIAIVESGVARFVEKLAGRFQVAGFAGRLPEFEQHQRRERMIEFAADRRSRLRNATACAVSPVPK